MNADVVYPDDASATGDVWAESVAFNAECHDPGCLFV